MLRLQKEAKQGALMLSKYDKFILDNKYLVTDEEWKELEEWVKHNPDYGSSLQLAVLGCRYYNSYKEFQGSRGNQRSLI
jgi:hypothetical protein